MKSIFSLLPALASLGVAVDFVIPEVASIVSQEHSKYPDIFGPSTGIVQATPSVNLKQLLALSSAMPSAFASPTPTASCSYWMEDIDHQGVAAFNNDLTYQVFRNVQDPAFGAKGDGMTDDTAAINLAISAGSRIGPADGNQSTNTPAVVYFPAGTYLVTSAIVDYYNTQLIGNPNCLPVIRAAPGSLFNGPFIIDGDQGKGFDPTTILFWRQIRNFIIDMTGVQEGQAIGGISWSTAQATSLQNVFFKMTQGGTNNKQTGLVMGDGSGGFLNDLTFTGGLVGMATGNQQFTMRNLAFSNAKTAIMQTFDWGWTYQGISIKNCSVGVDMSNGGYNNNLVSAIVFMDSQISNTPVGFLTARNSTSKPPAAGSLVLDNVVLKSVPVAVKNLNGDIKLKGTTPQQTTLTIAGWASGHTYNHAGGPTSVSKYITPIPRPASLLSGSQYYTRSKPQYEDLVATNFVSVRDSGAKGDGGTDDTAAIQTAINTALAANKVCFFDAGTYKVTKTILIPPGSRVVGESYSVVMSSGSFFANEKKPKPVIRVGSTSGQAGTVEWSDMIVATQGRQPGAILIEWNLAAPKGTPAGMWDVHTRIGGFAGSNLQEDNCPTNNKTTITSSNYIKKCVAAHTHMHVTRNASSLYMENVWLWTADHDVDANVNPDGKSGTQITIYTPRGFLSESANGPIWMYGTAAEHNTLYQYQIQNSKNMFLGQIQTETPYYQPNPPAPIPFVPNTALGDPTFPKKQYTLPDQTKISNANAWGLRIVDSSNIVIYGAGHYSFFINYDNTCAPTYCQARIVSLESTTKTPLNVYFYDLHTVGSYVMLSTLEQTTANDVIYARDNVAGFPREAIAYFPTS